MVKSKNILLLGSYGRGNIGDEALLIAALKLLAGHNIVINSAGESDLMEIANTRVVKLNTRFTKEIPKKIKTFLKSNYIVYGGGELWITLEGHIFPHASLYKMIFVNIVAKMFAKKVFYLGCGAGDLKGYARLLAKSSASFADALVLRDSLSAQILGKQATIISDLTVNLNWEKYKRMPSPSKKFKLGISILYHLPDKRVNFPALIYSLKKLISQLPTDKFDVTLLPLFISTVNHYDDVWASEQLRKTINSSDIGIHIAESVEDFITVLARQDLVIAARLHANIMALLCGVPCIGISYRPKVSKYYQQQKLMAYCLDIANISELEELFWRIINDYDSVKLKVERVRKQTPKHQRTYEKFVIENF